MAVLYLLISISLLVALLFLFFFLRSVKSGQFDDTYTPSVRILFDETTDKQNSINIKPQPTNHGDSKI